MARREAALRDALLAPLRVLLAEYPALVSWRDEGGETLLSSTTPYALDVSDPERERRVVVNIGDHRDRCGKQQREHDENGTAHTAGFANEV